MQAGTRIPYLYSVSSESSMGGNINESAERFGESSSSASPLSSMVQLLISIVNVWEMAC